MIKFQQLGSATILAPVFEQLLEAGAEETDTDPALVIVGASSVPEAELHLSALPLEQRRRTVLVGLHDWLHKIPEPGSFTDLVERFQVLGAIALDADGRPRVHEFIGPLGDAMSLIGANPFKGSSSVNYAMWHGMTDQHAGRFLSQLVSAFERDGQWFLHGPLWPWPDLGLVEAQK